MNKDVFGGALRVLNQVPRWGCVPRIKESSVSAHSYWVIVYADLLCQHLEVDTATKLEVLEFAIHHDMPEAASGDILGPVKRTAVDPDKLAGFVARSFESWGISEFLPVTPSDFAKNVVKAADIIDDLMALSEEQGLGNRRVDGLYRVILDRLQRALTRLGCDTLVGAVMDSCSVVRNSSMTIVQEDSDVVVSIEEPYEPLPFNIVDEPAIEERSGMPITPPAMPFPVREGPSHFVDDANVQAKIEDMASHLGHAVIPESFWPAFTDKMNELAKVYSPVSAVRLGPFVDACLPPRMLETVLLQATLRGLIAVDVRESMIGDTRHTTRMVRLIDGSK